MFSSSDSEKETDNNSAKDFLKFERETDLSMPERKVRHTPAIKFGGTGKTWKTSDSGYSDLSREQSKTSSEGNRRLQRKGEECISPKNPTDSLRRRKSDNRVANDEKDHRHKICLL